ncbi:hypothetical protein BC826DRAFT_38172 [Russula brevipes]|nr:hypothetical protein BC826DRAFT_38172 [Russula brevipes]
MVISRRASTASLLCQYRADSATIPKRRREVAVLVLEGVDEAWGLGDLPRSLFYQRSPTISELLLKISSEIQTALGPGAQIRSNPPTKNAHRLHPEHAIFSHSRTIIRRPTIIPRESHLPGFVVGFAVSSKQKRNLIANTRIEPEPDSPIHSPIHSSILALRPNPNRDLRATSSKLQ